MSSMTGRIVDELMLEPTVESERLDPTVDR
jgi:hypothetical protein